MKKKLQYSISREAKNTRYPIFISHKKNSITLDPYTKHWIENIAFKMLHILIRILLDQVLTHVVDANPLKSFVGTGIVDVLSNVLGVVGTHGPRPGAVRAVVVHEVLNNNVISYMALRNIGKAIIINLER